MEDSSRVADHAHKFTTGIDRVSPQLYYSVVITEIKVGNISVSLVFGLADIYLPSVVFKEVKRATAVYCNPWTARR